jgi:hypothetical protein
MEASMCNTGALQAKPGAKPGENRVQNLPQYRVKTRVKPGECWTPHTPYRHSPSLKVGRSLTIVSFVDFKGLATGPVNELARDAAPASFPAGTLPGGQRISVSHSLSKRGCISAAGVAPRQRNAVTRSQSRIAFDSPAGLGAFPKVNPKEICHELA